ncbi:hypothetical protein FJ986_23455 [Mesorhizobium sp. B1-1-1]|uniref:hypothetical protein n=1 Tax=Mesorhizobium sp. B1-1-1 TaxID=2589983 RepID=UPI001129F61C|nr:hypothetical protein [Mesorhizobium sp. B1-1-1]TPN63608.1 hypothetical protein FJ986_23455 [Mesorhizobium sp. B1-1-1]
MDLGQWHYFLSLERDFERTLDYVELAEENHKAYSNEYAKLLLLVGSEVDIVAKILCKDINAASTASNILHYQTEICARFAGMHTIEIDIPRYRMSVLPWLDWGNTPLSSPGWWRSYNNVKHGRDANFNEASQGNVTAALCGLLALHLYIHRDTGHLQPYPKLLEFAFPQTLVARGSGKTLPGV